MKTTRLFMLTAALLGSSVQATGITPPTQISNAYDFYKRNKAWLTSLTDLQSISDRIFNEDNMKNIAGVMLQRLADQGFNTLGINPDGFLNDMQAQIDAIKAEINKGQAYIASGAFMKPGTKDVDTSIAFNPTLQQMKRDSAVQRLQADEQTKVQLQNTADSAKTVEETLKTSETLQDRAKDVASQSLELGNTLNGVDSTRDGVQVLGQIILEDMNNRAMSDAALAAQFAQLARSMDITNQTMGAVVSDIIAKKKGEAQARQQIVEEQVAQSVARADQTAQTIESTGVTISNLTAPTTPSSTSVGDLLRGN
ncbi:hypothetical protein GO986_12300 [Deinococcus sp. HMF7620]|uniref:Uncharacterized protein n=1 Tax=Deinococcus arboris TaxID=2682977 RepID=A0A7C9HSH0_9DEIO|nr:MULTISPECIES: hypothetical protein [Deinococcus]MBZ9752199.1 hypothetical protein [Deinococcus betulae]MVN87547.1 hypothetical protein [Deinococcus arboris]